MATTQSLGSFRTVDRDVPPVHKIKSACTAVPCTVVRMVMIKNRKCKFLTYMLYTINYLSET